MLSGIGPGAHLNDMGLDVMLDRAGIGANLQDHIDYVSSWETRSADPFGDSAGGTWRMVKAIFEHRTRRSGIMTRSEEHTSELQSLMRISYAVFCLKKKKKKQHRVTQNTEQQKH